MSNVETALKMARARVETLRAKVAAEAENIKDTRYAGSAVVIATAWLDATAELRGAEHILALFGAAK